MVNFRLPGSKKLDVDDAVSTSSSSLPEEGSLEGPATPDGVAAPAAAGGAAKPKYWPTVEEVEALLQRLPEQDRQQCDAAMANRWAPKWCSGLGRGRARAGPVLRIRGVVPCGQWPCHWAASCLANPSPTYRRRYLRATGGDQKHAAKRVSDTLAWRRAEEPEHIVCTACRADHKSHYMQVGASQGAASEMAGHSEGLCPVHALRAMSAKHAV